VRQPLVWALAVGAAWLVACGGGSDAPAEPTLAPPPIDPRLRVLEAGAVRLEVAAGASQTVDAMALAAEAGVTSACGDIVFLFNWRVGRSQSLTFVGSLPDDRFDVARGREGQASVSGCILLDAVNEGSGAAKGDLRYFIAEVRR